MSTPTTSRPTTEGCPDGIRQEVYERLINTMAFIDVGSSNRADTASRSYDLGKTRTRDDRAIIADRPRFIFTGEDIVEAAVQPSQRSSGDTLQSMPASAAGDAETHPVTQKLHGRLFLARHGRAANNVSAAKGKSGPRDAMLILEGVKQCESVARTFEKLTSCGLINISAVLSSSLHRARHSALTMFRSLLDTSAEPEFSAGSATVPFIIVENLRELLTSSFKTVRRKSVEGETDPTIEPVWEILGQRRDDTDELRDALRTVDGWADATSPEGTFGDPAVKERALDMLEDVVRTVQVLHELNDQGDPSEDSTDDAATKTIDIGAVSHLDFVSQFSQLLPDTPQQRFSNADVQLLHMEVETRGRVTDPDWSATVRFSPAARLFGPSRPKKDRRA